MKYIAYRKAVVINPLLLIHKPLAPIKKMMRKIQLILLILITNLALGQDLPVIKDKSFNANVYSKTEQVFWEKGMEQLAKINSGDLDYRQMSEKDKAVIDSLEMMEGPMTEGVGCSWYCGGGPYKITASSYLKEQSNIHYLPENIHDFDLLTAWVPEGSIGMKINFHFKPFAPRVNEIVIWNGYIKNIDLWKANSRVAKLKLSINGKPIAILALEDSTNTQSFPIDPVQSTNSTKDMILTLEILEIYKGTKYADVAISEINFKGLDVHCFGSGTEISLKNGTTKKIENIDTSDIVISYDLINQTVSESKVSKLITARHSNLVKMKFKDRDVIVTSDHPFWTQDKSWASLNPQKSNQNYLQEIQVRLLSVGDRIFVPANNEFIEILDILELGGEQLTYTLELINGDNFIANGLLVKTEKLKLIK